MAGRSDHAAGQKRSLIDRIAHFGEKPAKHGPRDKTVYYSSDLFNAAMMVDATRSDDAEPPAEDEEEVRSGRP